MQEKKSSIDINETLMRAIDLLTIENLRLKTENEILKRNLNKNDSQQSVKIIYKENVWSKAKNYYKREGFKNTFKKIFRKVLGKQQ